MSDSDIIYESALALWNQGKKEEAVAAYRSILSVYPEHIFALNDLGSVLAEEGRLDDARELIEQAYRCNPMDADIRQNVETLRAAYWQSFEQNPETPNPYCGSTKGKIRIAIVYDVVGWAWWHRAHQIARNLPDDFEVSIVKCSTPIDHTRFDLLLIFDVYLVERWPNWNVPNNKVIIGCSNAKLLQHTQEAMKQQLYKAAVINNAPAFGQVADQTRYYCCQNGVDTDLFYPSKLYPSEFLACWVGNSTSMANKGLDIIRQGCRQAEVDLLVVDAATIDKKDRAQPQEWLRDNVYHQASVFVCASEFEGTPNPALESLACGIPVLSTPVGNMPELLVDGYNGYLIERSAESIADKLAKVRKQDKSILRRNCRNTIVNGWTWNDQARKYAQMFHELAPQPKASTIGSHLGSLPPLRVLFLCDCDVFRSKMSRVRFHGMKALSRICEVTWWGPNWPGWDNAKSVSDNYAALGKECDIAVVYKPLDMIGFRDLPIPKCIRYNEMYDVEWTEREIRESGCGLVVCHHENEMHMYDIPGVAFEYVGHAAQSSIFYYDPSIEKTIDLMLAGSITKHYPLRQRFQQILPRLEGMGYKVYHHKHPGYDHTDSYTDRYLKEFADVVRQTRVVLTCSGVPRTRYGKYIEIPACGTVLCADKPTDEADDYLYFVQEVNVEMSDDEIIAKIRELLDEPEKLQSRIAAGLKFAANYTQEHYAERLHFCMTRYLINGF